GPDKRRGKTGDQVVVRIGAANLRSLSTGGSGDVELERVGGERFSLASDGPGDVRARGAVRELLVTSSGSGDLDLRQLKADKLDLTMS
ncbi:GIN domain-containing protein, partial [Achromobacter sp. GbtcB20]|uniref:GIN domain-containing protein n=1 Tax=Achromobacter sp. GbtcB20 TaxID=2824765 RepID=UPI001C300A15